MPADGADLRCSAKRCSARPTVAHLWNNPSLHEQARRKAWLACEEHREHLGEFLALRGFLRSTCPIDEIPEGVG